MQNNAKKKATDKPNFEVPKTAHMLVWYVVVWWNCHLLCSALKCFCLTGVKGEQGLMGVPGMTGVKGERGPVGPKGDTGPPGKVCISIPTAHQISCIYSTCDLLSWSQHNPILLQVSMGTKAAKVLLHFPSEFQERGAFRDHRVSKDRWGWEGK